MLDIAANRSPGDWMTGAALQHRFDEVRARTEALCRPLEVEDHVVQAMPDVSPPLWHLGHTTWFYETFVLRRHVPGYQLVHPGYPLLFNSYYVTAGPRHPRPQRGVLTRPTVREVRAYRAEVDDRVRDLLDGGDEGRLAAIAPLLELGLHHEQRHQELLLTDVKYNLFSNPLRPAYDPDLPEPPALLCPTAAAWIPFEGGMTEIGHAGDGFHFDDEGPAHPAFTAPFALQDRPVTNREFLAFVEAGGYRTPRLWHAEGWDLVEREGWQAPLYWERIDEQWMQYTLGGLRPLAMDEPVCHVSHYEAHAYAAWAGRRLPTEVEWELAARECGADPAAGHYADDGVLHPGPVCPGGGASLRQLYGDVWEWTASAYLPYPGHHAPEGTIGEYDGKSMSGQAVLRGGSVATPRGHLRPTYRNSFHPDKRWQFSGIRLAADL